MLGFPLRINLGVFLAEGAVQRSLHPPPHSGIYQGFDSICLIILNITLQERSMATEKHLGEINRSDQRPGEQKIRGETERMKFFPSREEEVYRRQPQKHKAKGELWGSFSPFLSPGIISAIFKLLLIDIALTCS